MDSRHTLRIYQDHVIYLDGRYQGPNITVIPPKGEHLCFRHDTSNRLVLDRKVVTESGNTRYIPGNLGQPLSSNCFCNLQGFFCTY